MPRIELKIGTDMDGDACVLFQILTDESEHIRYANEEEVGKYLAQLSEAGAEPEPEDLGICLTCGASCSDDGTCEEACIDCGEHFKDTADGSDGLCPSCANAMEPAEQEDETNG